jgi:hypothetical protein
VILKNCDVKQFLAETRDKKIVCFGAGLWAGELSLYFPHFEIEKRYAYIVDNNSELWGTHRDIGDRKVPVCSPQKLYDEADDGTVVLITIANCHDVYVDLQNIDALRNVNCYCAIYLWGEETDRISLTAPGPVAGWRMCAEPQIPKVIHYCWIGGNPIPDCLQKYVDGWKRLCPDYDIKLWNEQNYDFASHPYMKAAYETGHYGFAPDYARFDIVYKFGGMYLDTDAELLKKPDELLYNRAFFGFQDSRYVAPGLGFGASCGHSLIRILRDAYDRVPTHIDGSFNKRISPHIQTDTLLECGLKPNGQFQTIGDAAVYPARFLSGKNGTTYRDIITDETIAVHHYAWTWGSEDERRKRENMRKLLETAGIKR